MGDMADDIIDRMIDDDHDPAKTCKFCGAFPLFWYQKNGKWVLLDQKGNVHSCKNNKRFDPFEGV